MSRYYYLEVVANVNCEAVNCPLAGLIQRVTHDGHVTHIAIYIHVAPRVAYPYLAPIDVQRHCRFRNSLFRHCSSHIPLAARHKYPAGLE